MLDQSNTDSELNPMKAHLEPTIALFPWGDVWEDFFGSIGVSFESFCNELTGGWLFGYIDALKSVGVKTVIFYSSTSFEQVSRFTHIPTGATICMLPVPKPYQLIRRQIVHPYPSLVYSCAAR